MNQSGEKLGEQCSSSAGSSNLGLFHVRIYGIVVLRPTSGGLGFCRGKQRGASIDIQKTGPLSSIDKKRTLLENIKRNALSGPPKMGGFAPEDLRFRVIGKEKEETNTAIIAVLDVSGSMGTRERYLAHTFYHWLLRVLRKKPGNRDIVFIHHDSGAGLVDEKQFFTLKGGGGTKVSAAYQKILELIAGNLPGQNIYPWGPYHRWQ